jgi:hypothetical protein
MDDEKDFNFFDNRDDALETVASLLRTAEVLAKRHNFPFLGAFMRDEYWLTTFNHLPFGVSCGELRAAWYEICHQEALRDET